MKKIYEPTQYFEQLPQILYLESMNQHNFFKISYIYVIQ